MQLENVNVKENPTGKDDENMTLSVTQLENIPQKKKHLTGKDVLIENIGLGETEEKRSGKFDYLMTQVLYDVKPFVILESGKMKIFSFNKKTFSVGLAVDEENRDYFQKIEKRISNLYDDLEINLIKTTHDYSKIYTKLYAVDGKIHTPIRLVENGKKKLIEPKEYIGIPFSGKIVLKISKIYDGSCVSLICEAKEVLIEEVFLPPSVFDEYSVED